MLNVIYAFHVLGCIYTLFRSEGDFRLVVIHVLLLDLVTIF